MTNMINPDKLYKMIKIVGRMDLLSLSERFPGETIESVKKIIEESDNLEIVGSFVKVKEDAPENPKKEDSIPKSVIPEETNKKEVITEEPNMEETIEEEVVEEVVAEDTVLKEIDKEDQVAEIYNITATGEAYNTDSYEIVTTPQNETPRNVATSKVATNKNISNSRVVQLSDFSNKKTTLKVESELTYEKVIDVIEKYNQKIQLELENILNDADTRKAEAIYKYLTERYKIEHFKEIENGNIYTQFDKENDVLLGYAVVVTDFDETTLKTIDSLFDTEMVFVYYTRSNYVGIPNTLKDIYIRPTEAILSEYMTDYEIDKIPVELFKIIEVNKN